MPRHVWTPEEARAARLKAQVTVARNAALRAQAKIPTKAETLTRDELFKRENLNSIRRGIRRVHRALADCICSVERQRLVANLTAMTKLERSLVNGSAKARGKPASGPTPKTFSPPVELTQVTVSDTVKPHNTS